MWRTRKPFSTAAGYAMLALSLSIQSWPQDKPFATPTISSVPPIAGSADDLKRLLQDSVSDAKKDDTDAIANSAFQLAIPHPEEWFDRSYSTNKARSWAEQYRTDLSKNELMLQQLFTLIAQNDGEIAARKVIAPVDPESAIDPDMFTQVTKPTDFYYASWHAGSSPTPNERGIGYFTFIDGSFRYINVIQPPLLSRSGTIGPKLIYNPQPEYPNRARKKGIEGKVVVTLLVGDDGIPTEAKIAQSLDPDLDEKALEAVRSWKFQPAMKNGHPVAVHVNVEVNFKLRQ